MCPLKQLCAPAMAAVAVRILDRAPITKQCNEIDFVIKPFTLYTYHVSCVAYVEVEQGGPFDGGVIASSSWGRKSNRSVGRGRGTRHHHFHGYMYFGQHFHGYMYFGQNFYGYAYFGQYFDGYVYFGQFKNKFP